MTVKAKRASKKVFKKVMASKLAREAEEAQRLKDRKKTLYRMSMKEDHGEGFMDLILVSPTKYGQGKPGFKAVLKEVETMVSGETIHSFIVLHWGKEGWWAKKLDDLHWLVMKKNEAIHEAKAKPQTQKGKV